MKSLELWRIYFESGGQHFFDTEEKAMIVMSLLGGTVNRVYVIDADEEDKRNKPAPFSTENDWKDHY